MLKIDVNKSGRIFDFLVSSGMLLLAYDPLAKALGTGRDGVISYGTEGMYSRPETHEIYSNGYG